MRFEDEKNAYLDFEFDRNESKSSKVFSYISGAFDQFLLYIILFIVFFMSVFVSMPELGKVVVWAGAIFRGNAESIEAKDIQSITLPLLTLIAILLVKQRNHFEFYNKKLAGYMKYLHGTTRRDVMKSIEIMIDSVGGVELKEFTNENDLKSYLNMRTREAQRSVDDLTWAHRRLHDNKSARTAEEQDKWRLLEREHFDIVTDISKRISYREVFILARHDRVEKLKQRHQHNAPYYFAAVHKDGQIPRLQFVLIDKQEAIFVSDNHKVMCSIKHPKFIKIFSDYFDDAWSSADYSVGTKNGRADWDSQKINVLIDKANVLLSRQRNDFGELSAISQMERDMP